MGAIHALVKDIRLPKMVRVRQKFSKDHIADVVPVLREELLRPGIADTVRPGMRIAITAGSRGIEGISKMTKEIVDFCKKKGAVPFIVAAMGSHGGASKEGQREVLAGYGITADQMGCPVLCEMDVVKLCELADGAPVMIDKHAAGADGIIVVNRVKAHTSFRARYESGLVKMMAIGLGKQSGAEACHHHGLYHMAENVERYGRAVHQHAKIMFGVAIVENAYEQTAVIRALAYDEILEEEPKLLETAKDMMAKCYLPHTDVLVVDEIGKNISGDGMDPNITGRYTVNNIHTGLKTQRVVILDISEQSHGNGNGLGLADITTMRAFQKFDREKSYPNVLTSTALCNCRIPPMFSTDKEALQTAVKTCTGISKDDVTIIRVKNTLLMEEIEISESLLPQAERITEIEIISTPYEWEFDARDNLF